jgi:hypothetical protein
MKRRVGLWIAIAALCVNAPRLAQAFLEADGLQLGESLRPILMGATGVAAALTLTGGGAWLAHELARGGARLQGLLMACWILVLGGQLVLIPPLLMLEMPGSRLGTVLPADWQRWSWAMVAVLLVELVAAGAMVAQGRRSAAQEQHDQDARELERIAAERNALAQRLRILESQPRSDSQTLRALRALPSSQGPSQRRTTTRIQSAKPHPVPCRNGCGWVGSSQNAENAHQRYCKVQ